MHRIGNFVAVITEAEIDGVGLITACRNPAERLATFQAATWRLLVVARAFECPGAEQAVALDRHLRTTLAGIHVRSAWFRASPDRIAIEAAAFANRHGFAISEVRTEGGLL
ncbi:hypothetical protein [Dongia sp.]|uniref:hypothetical protein n=1 Tax=Dongia sp. TaxID=1977262 RepID=UPI0037526287